MMIKKRSIPRKIVHSKPTSPPSSPSKALAAPSVTTTTTTTTSKAMRHPLGLLVVILASSLMLIRELALVETQVGVGLCGGVFGALSSQCSRGQRRELAAAVVCHPEALVGQWKANATAIAATLTPETQLPSRLRPFFFFHLRKAGGTTLRNLIGDAAKRHNLSHWVPCYERNCIPFSIAPGTEPYDVYASHLEYHTAMQMLGEFDGLGYSSLEPVYLERSIKSSSSSSPEQQRPPTAPIQFLIGDHRPFSCMTRLRKTVERVTSCWNYLNVQFQEYPNPKAHELADDEWEQALRYVDCSNEIVRMFGSVADIAYYRTANPCDGHATAGEMETILSRMGSCVMTHNDRCDESKEVVSAFLPWLADTYRCEDVTNAGVIEKKPLSDASVAAILRVNQYDDYLFQFGEALFEAQLQRARELLVRRRATTTTPTTEPDQPHTAT